MAEANQLEKIAQAAPQAPQQEKKEEPKKPSTLESVVNETLHFGKSLFNLGLAGAVPFAQALALPRYARDTAILSGAQVLGDASMDRMRGKKYTSGSALESSLVGTLTTIPTYHMFDLINKVPTETALGYVTKASAWGGLAYPAYIGMYQFIDYLIKNRTFKGVGKYIKENYWTTLKKAWRTTFPISLISIFFAPLAWQIPISALIQYGFVLFGAPKKGEVPAEKKRDPTPYYVAASNALGRGLYNLFWAPLNLAYATGTAMRNLYDKIPTTSPQLAPAQAPAGATPPARR